ncbi:hypothetical protein P154DRAFT_570766 [Amniculicola lignicola CBS 123094]|uniref:Extracellular membrane protein CFEM domain-containing protein n=1 Tax=Amniculicola lignicola CBS 123094 TaxID=1392246 RepID=A0A6A5X2P2_9PLEO|nr:hypothetical protein P154DRAFT_570766 [Amniculicola lignicola CBS 123094]
MHFPIIPFLSLVAIPALAQITAGPCDNTPNGSCARVRDATTCFASIQMGTGRPMDPAAIDACVDDENAVNARNVICSCYGCDSVLEIYVNKQSLCPNATVVARHFRS